jgi:hypothetical protein
VSLGECDGDEDTDGTGVVSIFLYSGSRVNAGLLHFGSSREAMARVGPVSGGDQKRRVALFHNLCVTVETVMCSHAFGPNGQLESTPASNGLA